nr:MAG TPA: hypothetical protein [Caudoviricetes sp.]
MKPIRSGAKLIVTNYFHNRQATYSGQETR